MSQACDTDPDPDACVASGCGNGIIEAGEGCDDGNATDDDGCTATCTKVLGDTCMDGTTCDSGTCDGTMNICVGHEDADSECKDNEDNKNMCEVSSCVCVECVVDAHCADQGITSTNDNPLPFALLDLRARGITRRR